MNRSDILLVVILIGVVIFAASIFAHMAYGEESTSIYGTSKELVLFVAFDEQSNMLRVITGEPSSVDYWDLNIKHFKSGGFRMSNEHILLFAHPVSTTEYKFVILTSDWVHRMNGEVIYFPTSEPKQSEEPTPTRIEPKSSVGADITKYDVPTTASRDVERELSLSVSFQNPTSIFVNTEYSPQIQVINEMSVGVEVSGNLKIQRDGVVLTDIDGISTAQGVWNPVINISYPTFYPGFCYDVTVTATSGNVTDTTTHDFLAVTSQKYFDGSGEYGIIPETIKSDGDCNK